MTGCKMCGNLPDSMQFVLDSRHPVAFAYKVLYYLESLDFARLESSAVMENELVICFGKNLLVNFGCAYSAVRDVL
jgi:hypothetical protein